MNSILTSIKKMHGLDAECEAFDQELTIHINSVLMILTQIGIGPAGGFYITGVEQTWEQFLGKDVAVRLDGVKTYVYLKTRLVFDPPSSSFVLAAIKEQAAEYESRLSMLV